METGIEIEQVLVTDPTDGNQFPVQVMLPLREGQYPLVVISHGTGGSYVGYRSLAGFLARNGFVVASVEHPYNNRNDNSRGHTLENLIDRPRHLQLALDELLVNPISKSRVTKDVALIGHSMGAYTALALAGGIPHTKHQIEHDPNCKITSSQEVKTVKDDRVKALVLFAPAAAWFASEGSLDQVKVPIFIFTGEKDHITPEFHADVIKGRAPDHSQVTHKVVKNAGHFSFMTPFPIGMRKPEFPPAMDPPGFDREAFQNETMNPEVLKFLREKLVKPVPKMV